MYEGQDWLLHLVSLGPQFFLFTSKLVKPIQSTPPPSLSSHLPLFPVLPSTSVIPCAAQSLPCPYVLMMVGCDASNQNNLGNMQGVSFQPHPDSALLFRLHCSDILTVRDTTLGWTLEAVVFTSEFSSKFLFTVWREVPHQPYSLLP